MNKIEIPFQYIDPTAVIGKNVKIWHFSYVGASTVIGDNTKIGSLTHIDYGVLIGKNCRIEGMVYLPPKTKIGNNVFIGPGVVFTNDPYPPSTKLAGITVEDNVAICAGAILKAGITIHEGAVIAMGAVVTKDVPKNVLVKGFPARVEYTRDVYDKRRMHWEGITDPEQERDLENR